MSSGGNTVHPVPYGPVAPAPTYPTYPAYPPPAYPAPNTQPQPQMVQPYPYQQPAVVIQQPTVVVSTIVPKFGPYPTTVHCPHCHNNVQTKVYYKIGGLTWLLAAIICFFGFWLGCCLLPFCINSCKDAEHICPSCNRMIGKYHRL